MRGPRVDGTIATTRVSPPGRSLSMTSDGASGSEIALLALNMAAQDTWGADRNPR